MCEDYNSVLAKVLYYYVLLTVTETKLRHVTKGLTTMEEREQIIRYRATATFRRPQIKQYTVSDEGRAITKLTGKSYQDLEHYISPLRE